MNLNIILDRLEKVKNNGKDKWLACCPSHDDKTPSLAIKDADDRLLIHCFAGCATEQIMDAMGLQLTDLFADGCRVTRANKPPRRDVERALLHELIVLNVAITSRHSSRKIHSEDAARENLAVKRISAIFKDLYHETK